MPLGWVSGRDSHTVFLFGYANCWEHSLHMVRFFLFSIELSIISDDACYFGIPKMIFLMYYCCKPLVFLLEKNLV